MKKAAETCCCQDPYADLPADFRPEVSVEKSGMREAICPNCSRKYWTNRDRHECINCACSSVMAR